MSRKRLLVCTMVAFIATHLMAREATGDDVVLTPIAETAPPPTVIGAAGYLHLRSSAHVITDGGADLRLPPGYYLDEPNWKKLDLEVRRLQEQEVRLTAENTSLRTTVGSWQPGWKSLASALVVGAASAWYVSRKF